MQKHKIYKDIQIVWEINNGQAIILMKSVTPLVFDGEDSYRREGFFKDLNLWVENKKLYYKFSDNFPAYLESDAISAISDFNENQNNSF